MPNSSVLATDFAVNALHYVKDETIKDEMIKDIVTYYENVYDEDKSRFLMVDMNVDDYPHAVWWNFKDVEKNFPFGNPDPEVIGFLYANRKHMKKLNFSNLINKVVEFIMSEQFLEAKMHTVMSVLHFYNRVDTDVKNLVHDRIHLLVNKELNAGLGKWDEYGLEPYKIYIIEPHFINAHLGVLGENLTGLINKINKLEVVPNWQWHQYEKVFKEVKYQWVGHMYFDMIRALKLHRVI